MTLPSVSGHSRGSDSHAEFYGRNLICSGVAFASQELLEDVERPLFADRRLFLLKRFLVNVSPFALAYWQIKTNNDAMDLPDESWPKDGLK